MHFTTYGLWQDYHGTKRHMKTEVTRCCQRPRIPPSSLDTSPCRNEDVQVHVHANVTPHKAILRSSLSRREASEYAPYVRAQRLKQTDARPSVHALYTLPRTRVIKTAHVQQHYSSAGRLCTCNIFCSSGADTTHKQPKPKHVLVAAEGQCFKWSLLALVAALLQDLANHELFRLIFPGLLR